jgi:hypothetical protein
MVLYSCDGCQERDREIARLRRRISELEQENHRFREELATTQREANRQAAPFRRLELKKRKKKPGRRKGHPPANRPTPPPERIDRVVEVPYRACPECATPLVDPGSVRRKGVRTLYSPPTRTQRALQGVYLSERW